MLRHDYIDMNMQNSKARRDTAFASSCPATHQISSISHQIHLSYLKCKLRPACTTLRCRLAYQNLSVIGSARNPVLLWLSRSANVILFTLDFIRLIDKLHTALCVRLLSGKALIIRCRLLERMQPVGYARKIAAKRFYQLIHTIAFKLGNTCC